MKFLTKFNEAKREVTAPILVPGVADLHGDIYSEEEVYKACRSFEVCKKTNLQHTIQLTDDAANWVESYTTPEAMTFKGAGDIEDVEVVKGTWMGTMHISNDTIWNEVKKGTFTGFSVGCFAQAVDVCKSLDMDMESNDMKALLKAIAGETGMVAKTRLSDFDFSAETCHVALVDAAANATQFLVMKSVDKVPESKEDRVVVLKGLFSDALSEVSDRNREKLGEVHLVIDAFYETQWGDSGPTDLSIPELKTLVQDFADTLIAQIPKIKEPEPITKTKGNSTMTEEEIKAMKARNAELEKAAIEKKVQQDEEIAKELAELKKSKAEDETELKALRKAKEDEAKEKFLTKAKDLGAGEDSDKVGEALYALKSVSPDHFEVVMALVEKMSTAISKNASLADVGEGSEGKGTEKTLAEKMEIIKKEVAASEPTLQAFEVRKKATAKFKSLYPGELEKSLYKAN